MSRERRQYGDQRTCGTCSADIEWHGRGTGWLDRGGNTRCSTSGHSWADQDGVSHQYPDRRHRPGSVFALPADARRR